MCASRLQIFHSNRPRGHRCVERGGLVFIPQRRKSSVSLLRRITNPIMLTAFVLIAYGGHL